MTSNIATIGQRDERGAGAARHSILSVGPVPARGGADIFMLLTVPSASVLSRWVFTVEGALRLLPVTLDTDLVTNSSARASCSAWAQSMQLGKRLAGSLAM